MKKYKVTIPEIHTIIVEVVANDEKEAFEKANDEVAVSGQHLTAIYEHTMSKDKWVAQCLGDAPEVEEAPYNPFERGEISESLEEVSEEEHSHEL